MIKGHIYVYVLAAILGLAVSAWIGYKVAAASYEKRIADIAEAIIEHQNTLVDRHNKELEAERRRFAEVQKKQAILASKVQGIIDETTSSSSRVWDSAQRMRLQKLYELYGYTSSSTPD